MAHPIVDFNNVLENVKADRNRFTSNEYFPAELRP